MNSAPTQVYYNLDIANEQISEIGVPPNKLSFTEVRSSAILDNPNDYFMSIVRFSLDTAGALPVFIPQIDTQQSNNAINYPNKTIYNITLSYYDAAAGVGPLVETVPIYYIPHTSDLARQQNQRLRPPNSNKPLTIQEATSEYYWVQAWGQWISMINSALAQVYNQLLVAMNAAGVATPADYDINNPPFFRWNDDTAKCSFICPASLFNQGGTPGTGFTSTVAPYNFPTALDATTTAFNAETPSFVTNAKVNIYFNAPLHILFSSFEWVFNSYSSAIGEAFMMRVYSKFGENFTVANAVAACPNPKQTWNALVMEQEYGTGPIMCPVSRIVFLASLIPVLPSNVGLPRIFSNSIANQAVGQNNNMANEVTDLIVNLVRGDEYLPSIIYEPTAEYRLLDLQSNTPSSSIQLAVQWQDIYGFYHDFYLQNGCGANLKIMFRKKQFNNIS